MKTLKDFTSKLYATSIEYPYDGRRLATLKTNSINICEMLAKEVNNDSVEIVELNSLRNSAIEDINKLMEELKKWFSKPFVNENKERSYQCKRFEIMGKLDYIKKKFNITDEDLKPKVEQFEIKPPQERQGTRHIPKMAEKYKDDLK